MSEKRRVSLGTKKRAWSRESLDWKEWQESSRERRGAGTPKQMSALHQNKKISFLYLKNVRWPNLNPIVFFFAGVGAELAGFWAPECDAVWLTLSLFDSPLQRGLVNDDTVRSPHSVTAKSQRLSSRRETFYQRERDDLKDLKPFNCCHSFHKVYDWGCAF